MLSAISGLLSFVLLYKYIALFCIGFVAAIALPIPASTTLVAAGAFAAQGYLSISLVLTTAFFANILGDATGYFLARTYGVRIFHIFGLGKLLTTSVFQKLENYIRNFPHTLIFISRFLTEIGPAVSVLSGISRVHYRTFLISALLGESCYVLLYGLTGYYLGNEWENNVGFLVKAVMAIVSIGVTLNVIQWVIYKQQKSSQ